MKKWIVWLAVVLVLAVAGIAAAEGPDWLPVTGGGEKRLKGSDYDFIPARQQAGATRGIGSVTIGEALKYEDGRLTVKLILDENPDEPKGEEIVITFQDLRVYNSLSADEICLGLAGQWEISISEDTRGSGWGEIDIGELRVYGVGKIALSANLSMAVKATFGGTFDTCVVLDGDGAHLTSDFDAGRSHIDVQGSAALSLKLEAGLDILVADAVLYTEIGIQTHLTSKLTAHPERTPPDTVECQDYKIHAFTIVGAEVTYQTAAGKTRRVAGVDWDTPDNMNPEVLDVHFENGERVGECTEGMDTVSPVILYGGIAQSFDSDLLLGSRERILETDVTLPWDIEVNDDLYISGGELDLNGFNLTVHGDLIQMGGSIKTGDTRGGVLTVDGDYKLQGETEEGEPEDSTGALVMKHEDARVIIGGNLIIQTTAEQAIEYGSITVEQNIFQYDPEGTDWMFLTGPDCPVILPEGAEHVISISDIVRCVIGKLDCRTDVRADSVGVGILELNGNSLNVSNNLRTTGDFNLDGGTLSVGWNYYQNAGTLTIGGGKLYVQESYYIADADSFNDYSARKVRNTRAYLHMTDPNDEITVGEDFLIASHGGHPYDSDTGIVIGGRYENLLSEGVMYIGGNFYQCLKDSPYGDSLFWPTDNHKVVFNGHGTQSIFCESAGNGFRNVEFRNRNIRLAGNYLLGFTLNEDLNLTLDTDYLEIDGEMDLNGHTLGLTEIAGNLTLAGGSLYSESSSQSTVITGSLSLDQGFIFHVKGLNLTVNGDLDMYGTLTTEAGRTTVKRSVYLRGGRLALWDSRMNIGQNLYITSSDRAAISRGDYDLADGYLEMLTNRSILSIGKHLVWASSSIPYRKPLDAGLVVIGGNFRQVADPSTGRGTASFQVNKCVFAVAGKGKHTVSFDSGDYVFGGLLLTHPESQYTITPQTCWTALYKTADKPALALPKDLEAIPESAFEGVSAKTVWIPDACGSVGKNAFKGAAVLAVRIPSGCTVDDTAFSGCGAVIVIGAPGSPAEAFCGSHSNCVFVAE